MVAELSADHHPVVSWIRWWERLPDRAGKTQTRGADELGTFGKNPIHQVFNRELRKSFLYIPGDFRNTEMEWTWLAGGFCESSPVAGMRFVQRVALGLGME